MKIRKLVYAILIALSAHPQAFAQNIDSASAGYIVGVDKAPPFTQIGAETGNTSQAVGQGVEYRTVPCSGGKVGTVYQARKVYTRQNLSQVFEEWYTQSDDCKQPQDGAIADLYARLAVQGGEIQALKNKAPVGAVSPIFTIRTGSFFGSTNGGTMTGFCFSGGFENWPNSYNQQITWDTLLNGQSSGVGTFIGPWPNWPGTQVRAYLYTGPLCPEGMRFTIIGQGAPEAPSGE
ncbi:hypothetical protein [Variovorax sp. E3]|uniref:hypothetical protein n=1 Tax=Variovorax sp. E3 TaxID=1914993 RepID=UPI0018DBF109|nr:hypothetical protein [Variovorax sp. E3]